MSSTVVDVLVIGGGQAGLATGYFLRRHKLDYLILDQEPAPGGAWRHGWDSLELFSPAQWSSLPGWQMPKPEDGEMLQRDDVIDYLTRYEKRYEIPVRRPVKVESVARNKHGLTVKTNAETFQAKAIVSATGTWRHPFIPHIEGIDGYQGRQIHSAHYQHPEDFKDQRVLVVGGGNSGAQIQAEVSKVAPARWVTRQPPRFLPDHVDGQALFEMATEKWKAEQAGRAYTPPGNLSNIVMVPPVKEARARGALKAQPMFTRLTRDSVIWPNGSRETIDAIIWCTGFHPALSHLESLGVVEASGRVHTQGTRSIKEQRLWLVGYGDWTGFASATLIGVMRSARATAQGINYYLADS